MPNVLSTIARDNGGCTIDRNWFHHVMNDTIGYIIVRDWIQEFMRAWSDNHPKAKLLARKRTAILDAAREIFLRVGYEGASMEGIATAAGVSIMTLYRHAESKDDLFSAAVLTACDYSPDERNADNAALMPRPLREILVNVGNRFQDKLALPDTISLFRAVMVETARFPHLAQAAYHGFVQEWQDNLDDFLSQRAEFQGMTTAARQKLVASFMDNLVGTGMLRLLLGLKGASSTERKRKSEMAAQRFLSEAVLE